MFVTFLFFLLPWSVGATMREGLSLAAGAERSPPARPWGSSQIASWFQMISEQLMNLSGSPGVHEFPENGGHSLTLHPHIPVLSTTLLYSALDGWMDG